MAGTRWLLIETFGGGEPSVIGLGSAPRKFVPLAQMFRQRETLATLRSAIAATQAALAPVEMMSEDGRRRTLTHPLLITPERMHAVLVWSGPTEETVPPRDPVGAWYFNLSTSKSTRSDDLLDLYGVAPENRAREHAIAGVFTRVITNSDESDALAKIVRSAPGTEHQAVWTVRRDDGALRAAHFSCRLLEEPGPAGGSETFFRGVTHDIGDATNVSAAPPPVILEHRVLDAAAEEGEFRAIMDLRTLRLLRWMGPPMPQIAWQSLAGEPEPEIHPEDLDIAKTMSRNLAHQRTSGTLRLRALDGGWKPVHARAVLMALDQHTTAALVTIREPDGD
ncbi:GAF domain-containing protein [Nocardia sp. CDC153]|uniref:GAF domain-containing protein n=1 Tax=Nocardia sp. CDC153 TaxID=3112167 RepID=UPI002DBDB825|nr:GAF domain-containing protein [Nocardia sp. CDC153]MEC3952780.1 GAF domain-containing protein [Nocardia sp. CDC153]